MSLHELAFVSFKPDGPTTKQVEAFTNPSWRLGLLGKLIDLFFEPDGRRHFWSRGNRFK